MVAIDLNKIPRITSFSGKGSEVGVGDILFLEGGEISSVRFCSSHMTRIRDCCESSWEHI